MVLSCKGRFIPDATDSLAADRSSMRESTSCIAAFKFDFRMRASSESNGPNGDSISSAPGILRRVEVAS